MLEQLQPFPLGSKQFANIKMPNGNRVYKSATYSKLDSKMSELSIMDVYTFKDIGHCEALNSLSLCVVQ